MDKATWQSYSKKTSAIDTILPVEDHLEAYEVFEHLIYTSVSRSIPVTNPSKGKPPVPWWDDRCKTLRRIISKCYSKYKERPT